MGQPNQWESDPNFLILIFLLQGRTSGRRTVGALAHVPASEWRNGQVLFRGLPGGLLQRKPGHRTRRDNHQLPLTTKTQISP